MEVVDKIRYFFDVIREIAHILAGILNKETYCYMLKTSKQILYTLFAHAV